MIPTLTFSAVVLAALLSGLLASTIVDQKERHRRASIKLGNRGGFGR